MATVDINYTTHALEIDRDVDYKPVVVPIVLNDFVVKESAADVCVLTNITSPIGLAEKIKYTFREVTDVYAGTSIDRSLWSPSKRGVTAYSQLTEAWSVNPSANETFQPYVVPVSGSITLKIPQNAAITSEMLENFLKRLIATLKAVYTVHDSEYVDLLPHMLRGAINPKINSIGG